MLRMSAGTIALLDAPDYGETPIQFLFNGTEAQAKIGPEMVTVDYKDGRTESWPTSDGDLSSMDHAVNEIVAWLDGNGVNPTSSGNDALCALEIIAALHISHDYSSKWVSLPLNGMDLDRPIRSG